MHPNQAFLLYKFVERYVQPVPGKCISVVDVGSLDVNGSSRHLFPAPSYFYTGCDIVAGLNVDIVLDSPDIWQDIGQFDVVITSNTMEHVKDLHKFIRNVAGLAKQGGLICVIAPFIIGEHKYPVDCWRFLPDGMRFLLSDIAGLSVVECLTLDIDTIGVARKLK